MSDVIVTEHTQDLYAMLLGDLQLLKARRGSSTSGLTNLSTDHLRCLLDGHPRFVLSKGRRDWGKETLGRYALEYANTFGPYWPAVKRERMTWRRDDEVDTHQLLIAVMDPQGFARFSQIWQKDGPGHS